jgi:hypothetical protein
MSHEARHSRAPRRDNVGDPLRRICARVRHGRAPLPAPSSSKKMSRLAVSRLGAAQTIQRDRRTQALSTRIDPWTNAID